MFFFLLSFLFFVHPTMAAVPVFCTIWTTKRTTIQIEKSKKYLKLHNLLVEALDDCQTNANNQNMSQCLPSDEILNDSDQRRICMVPLIFPETTDHVLLV